MNYLGPKPIPLAERFWKKVDKHGPIANRRLGRCWVWTGALAGKGYGNIWDQRVRRIRKATHIAWEFHHGKPFPTGMMACHHCDNMACVRWSHIYVGNGFTNAQDRLRRGRHNFASLTHCLKGHPLTEDNVYRWGTRRKCRICQRQRHARYCAKRRAQGYWKSGQSHGWKLIKGKR